MNDVPHRDFEAFQSADTVWYHHAEFINHFAALTSGDETMASEAAFTKPGFNPGFINAQFDVNGNMAITIRGEPSGGQNGDNLAGPWARINIPLEDWDQFLADVARLPRPDPALGQAQAIGVVHEAGTADAAGVPVADESLYGDEEAEDARLMELADQKHEAQMLESETEDDYAARTGATAGDPLAQRAWIRRNAQPGTGDAAGARGDAGGEHPAGGVGGFDPADRRGPLDPHAS